MSTTLYDQIIRANFNGSTVVRLADEDTNIDHPLLTKFGAWCGLTQDIEEEVEIARHISRLGGNSPYWIKPTIPTHFDVDQRHAVNQYFNCNFVVLCGSGGSGKTTVLVQIVQNLLDAQISEKEIALISPLAVIASRLGSKCGVAGYTIHRLLRFKQLNDEQFEPFHNESNPLSQTFFIIDEATLLNNSLALALLRAIPTGARVLIAGDKKQLKGVGKGDLFSCLTSLTEKNASIVELKNNYRFKGAGIERFADLITNNTAVETFKSDTDLKFNFTNSDEETYEMLRRKLQKIEQVDAVGLQNIQILCPEHDGLLGTKSLNSMARGIGGKSDIVGERVVFKSNNYQWSLFNGQTGTIKSSDNVTCIEVQGREYKLDTESLWDSVEPAYALTPNRCQGAEFSLVIVIIPHKRTHIDLCWIYACCTRAKQCLAVIGSENELRNGINKRTYRDTLLKDIVEPCYL